MTNWQVTLVTIFCEVVRDEVTITVHNDWSVKCTGYAKSGKTNGAGAALTNSSNSNTGRQPRCDGSECSRVTQYREKLQAEEVIRARTITHGEQPDGVRRPDGSDQR